MGYYTEKMLRENRWTKIAFKRLSSGLAELEEFGPTPANSMMWLNRAKAEGILVTEQEAHRADPTSLRLVFRARFPFAAAAPRVGPWASREGDQRPPQSLAVAAVQDADRVRGALALLAGFGHHAHLGRRIAQIVTRHPGRSAGICPS